MGKRIFVPVSVLAICLLAALAIFGQTQKTDQPEKQLIEISKKLDTVIQNQAKLDSIIENQKEIVQILKVRRIHTR